MADDAPSVASSTAGSASAAAAASTSDNSHSNDVHMHEVGAILQKKLERRPTIDQLEQRNYIKTNRVRHLHIDFAESSATLSVHLKARAERAKTDQVGKPPDIKPSKNIEIPFVAPVLLPRGRLVAPPGREFGPATPTGSHSPLAFSRSPASMHTMATSQDADSSDVPPSSAAAASADQKTDKTSALTHSHSADSSQEPAPTISVSGMTTSQVLRYSDLLLNRGFMKKDENEAVADAIAKDQLPDALARFELALNAIPVKRRSSVLKELGIQTRKPSSSLGVPSRAKSRRATITVTSMSSLFPNSRDRSSSVKNKEEEEEDDELRSLNNLQLILDRIKLEKGLSDNVVGHVNTALQYLKEATNICKLRATHIERRMQKKLDLDVEAGDREVVQWISQEYMERAPKAVAALPKLTHARSATEMKHRHSDIPQRSRASTEILMRDTKRHNSLSPEALKLLESGRKKQAQRKASEITANVIKYREVSVLPDVKQALRLAAEWNFDVFLLDEASRGCPLRVLVMHVLDTSGLIERLNLSRTRCINFISTIERGYLKDNPFHNNIHASDVTQTMYYFLNSDVMRATLRPIDMLASIIGAAIHDFAHPGTTNPFQIATSSPLALRYNDQSVLENHHIASAFRVLQNPENDMFESFTREERQDIRESIIQMVLATDMVKHVHYVAELEADIKNKHNKKIWFDRESKADRHLLMNLGLHSADLSNPCKPRYIYCLWVERLMKEFYAQGDRERVLGLPISPMMDRHKPVVERSQVGFIDFVIKPLYVQWQGALGYDIEVCIKHLVANREFYSSKIPKPAPTPTASSGANASSAQAPASAAASSNDSSDASAQGSPADKQQRIKNKLNRPGMQTIH